MTPESQEGQLIDRCLAGENAAWDEFFRLHYAAAARYAYQLSPHLTLDDAEDIAQEVMLAAVRTLPDFKRGSRLQTWLFRIAGNKARDFRDRQTARKRGGGQLTLSLDAEDPETGLPPNPPSPDPAPDDLLAAVERAGELRAALNELGGPCREIIELRYFGDLSYEALSGALELNPKTVSSRLSKCLDKLGGLFARRVSRENPSNSTV